MKYDFETLVDRTGTGSGKWDEMKKKKPDLSPGVVPFSVADMEFKNAPEIGEGLKKYMDTHILGYTGPTDAYYDAVCGWMKQEHGWEVKPESIVCTLGVVPALFTLVKTFCQPGDGVIVMPPVYYPFYMAAENSNCEVRRCPLIYRDNNYTIDFDLLDKIAAEKDTKMLIFCNPHNPVGRVWTKEELKRVGEICLKHDVRVVSDEIHSDLIMPGHTHTVFAQAGDFGDKIIVCTAPSKTFNLAAMQTSNIIIPNKEDREKFQEVQGHSAPGALGLEACRIAYTQCRPWMEEAISVIWSNYQFAVKFLKEHLPEIKPVDLQGTYLMWLDCTALGRTKEELEELMVQKAELFLDEGYVFGEEGAGFERVNLACPQWVLKAALERLEKAIKNI